MMRKLLLTTAAITLMGSVAFTPAVMAQTAVAVRSGQHDTHTRLVFDWPAATTYEVKETTPGQVTLTFRDPAALNVSAVKADDVIKGINASGQTVTVNIAPLSTFRHFLVGNKVVLDIFKPQGAAKAAPQAASQAATKPLEKTQGKTPEKAPDKAAEKVPEKAPEKTAEKIPEKTPEKSAATPPAIATPPTGTLAAPAEEKTLIQNAIPNIEPHVITIAATEMFGMAAFVDNGYLWLVMDKPNMTVPPTIAGNRKDLFPRFEQVNVTGGTAYMMRIPAGVAQNIRAEGGGLIWRVIIPTGQSDEKYAALKRVFAPGQVVRGGTARWPMTGITKLLDVKNPLTGQTIKVATVSAATQSTGPEQDYVDFAMLKSAAGAAVVPKVDDLAVKSDSQALTVTRPDGLALSRETDVGRRAIRKDVVEVNPMQQELTEGGLRRIFDFDRWMMGGLTALGENERVMKSALPAKQPEGRIQDLLTLAKMNLSNDRGQEALGYMSIALDELPQLQDNLEYLALRGSSYALAGKPELGWKDLSNDGLKQFTELGYWKSYTLASLEDWDQSYTELPKDVQLLSGYPKPLLEKIGLKLAESALRGGDVPLAEKILVLLERDRSTLKPWTKAGLDYLRGEAARQAKDTATTRKLWEPLIEGKDRLYRARAGLALTMLELQEGKINRDKAIDRLEGLRYAWRGDELEAQINYMLGRLYLDNDQYVKGFAILRDASTMALPDSNIGKDITAYMSAAYSDLILKDKDLSPLDAATIYEEFKELTPGGDEGNAVIQRLAERLVEADLLDRAAALLQHQVDFRVQGDEKGRVATRLAGIYLLDKNPRPAMEALNAAEAAFNGVADMTEAQKKEHKREIDLLRARALSKINRTSEAITLLNSYPPDPDINALRADIAWGAGLWEDAAEALQDLILDEAMDLKRPVTARQADLILNRAVALSLANDRVALATMRTDYLPVMNQSARAQVFDVITRPRKVSTVADRETIANIVSETDMFKDFLDGYRKVGAEAKATAAPPSGGTAPAATPTTETTPAETTPVAQPSN